LLVGDENFGSTVPDKGKVVVVGRFERLKKRGAGGEKRYILDIGVMFLVFVSQLLYNFSLRMGSEDILVGW
jgi:hypothetical protein